MGFLMCGIVALVRYSMATEVLSGQVGWLHLNYVCTRAISTHVCIYSMCAHIFKYVICNLGK